MQNIKNRGLSNRFPNEVREAWIFWHDCLVCGKNNYSALHHIISPTVRFYKKGLFNKSALNSCPIHNDMKCHLYNESYLHDDKIVKKLLLKVYAILLIQQKYQLRPIDKDFLFVYRKLYDR